MSSKLVLAQLFYHHVAPDQNSANPRPNSWAPFRTVGWHFVIEQLELLDAAAEKDRPDWIFQEPLIIGEGGPFPHLVNAVFALGVEARRQRLFLRYTDGRTAFCEPMPSPMTDDGTPASRKKT